MVIRITIMVIVMVEVVVVILQIVQLIILRPRSTVLSIILQRKSPYDLMKRPNIKETIEALMPYTGESTQ